MREGLNSSVSGYGVMVGLCENDSGPLISIIDGELLEALSDCKLLHCHRHLLLTYRSKTVICKPLFLLVLLDRLPSVINHLAGVLEILSSSLYQAARKSMK